MSITGSNNPFACNPVVFANANSIVSLGTITRSIVNPNQFIFSVGFKWKINGVLYQNTAPITITIAEASEGFQRIDNALLNTSNTIELQQGLESETIALRPVAPDTNIILTSWNISGDAIGDTETPIVGTQFKQKNENQKFNPVLGGTTAVITIQPFGQNYYSVVGPVTGIVGFSKALITASPTAEVPYAGKDFYIENKTDHNVTLKNAFSPVDIPFHLGADLIVPTNGIVWLKYNPNTEKMDLFFKSWSEVDLSQKADLVGGKVPTSQLPFYVDDVLEFADFDAFPTTGETGIIYVALDKNFIYRWSGSVYVPIGNVPEVEQQLQRYWYSMTVNTLNTTLMLVNNTNSFAISGTASVVSRASTTYYNSIAMNNYLSATANGSNCGIKNNNQGDGSYLEGFDSSFVFINNDTNVNCETTVGYYGLFLAIPNIPKSAYNTNFVGVGNDVGDVNLSFYCKRNTETPSYTKVDCGSSFPAHTTTDAYILRMQMSRGYNGSGRTLKMTITNIITGAVFSHTFTDSQIPSSSTNIAMVVNRSNRNTGVVTNIRFSKWHQTKYLY